MEYRSDLEGLRGLAVVQVILFHAGVTLFSGGYVGVDVFYVLSGFLITFIINNKIDLKNFTFSDFYLGRVRRLLPVYLFFLFIVTIAASYLLIPDNYIDYLRSIKYSLIFRSNIFFDRITGGYFAPAADTLLLLHTWSLSIEWQFYLLWPFIFYCFRRLFSVKVTTVFVITGFVAFAAYSQYLVISNPEHSYYLFSARVFEMLGGASLALALGHLPKINLLFSHILSVIALAALIYFSISYTDTTSFPGLNALWVSMASLILIYTGSVSQDTAGNKFLSFRPIVFIGTLSYSLYLWHWPVFVILRDFNIQLSALVVCCAIAVIFIVSFCSWQFVEKPFRFKYRYSFKKSIAIYFLTPVAMIILCSELAKNNGGFPQRFGAEAERIHSAIESVVTPNIDKCNPPANKALSECMLGVVDKKGLNAVLLGDSHARHFREFVDVMAKDAGWSVYGVTGAACLAVPTLKMLSRSTYCEGGMVDHIYEVIKTHKPEYAIFAQNWMGYAESPNMGYQAHDEQSISLSEQRIEESVLAAMDIIVDGGTTPIIIKSAPGNNVDQRHCVYQHIKERRRMRDKECTIYTSDENANNAKAFIDQLFIKIAERHPQTIFIDPRLVLCNNGECFTSIDGVPIYRDAEHINSYASRWLANRYLSKFGNPLIIAPQ